MCFIYKLPIYSVKWLLEHEFRTIDSSGNIVENTETLEDLPLFWQKVKPPMAAMNGKGKSSVLSAEGVHWWYYNRLTGALTEDKPAVSGVGGAMLCEEMGLGK